MEHKEYLWPDDPEQSPQSVAEHMARYRLAMQFAVGKTVLDLGCGAGYGAFRMSRTAKLVVGIDQNTDAIDYAREHYGGHGHGHPIFTRSQIERIAPSSNIMGIHLEPMLLRKFDVVTSFEVMEHMEDPNRLLTTARKFMHKKTSILILSVPFYHRTGRASEEDNPYHHWVWDLPGLVELMRKHFNHIDIWVQYMMGFYPDIPLQPGTGVGVGTSWLVFAGGVK